MNRDTHTWEERAAFYNKEYFVDYGAYITEDGIPSYKHRPLEGIVACARIVRDITGARSVLDCGCANGWLVDAFRILDPSIYIRGFDISAFAIEHVVPEIRDLVQVCDISEGLPFDDRRFDLVVGFDILEHQQDYKRIMMAVSEMCRLAKTQILLRQPMVFHQTPCDSKEPAKMQEAHDEWIASVNVLPHRARLALVGVHPYLASTKPTIGHMEHPHEHPRHFWIELFDSLGFCEVPLPDEYYIYPNPLHFCSFNVLMFRRSP